MGTVKKVGTSEECGCSEEARDSEEGDGSEEGGESYRRDLIYAIYTIICLKSVCRSTFADCRGG